MKTLKNFLASAALLFSILITYAQAPQGFNYQAVVRDGTGNIFASGTIGMQFTIHEGSAGGTTVFQETHTLNSNAYGLVTAIIGQGTVVSGDFTTIDWSGNSYFLQVEADPAGGTNYSDMGTTQLMSVPYALSAKTAEVTDSVVGGLLWTMAGNKIYNNNSGHVGIGTTNPGSLLHLRDANSSINASQLTIEANTNYGAQSFAAIEFRANASSAAGDISGRIKSFYVNPSYASATMTFQTITAGPAFVDAMSLTDGKVGIGTTTPEKKLDVNGNTVFRGIVGIGTTSPATQLHVVHGLGGTGNGLTISNSSTAGTDWQFYSNSSGNFVLIKNGTTKGVFDGTSGAYTAGSDRKLKKDIVPLGTVLDKVMQLNPSMYHFKTQEQRDDRKYIGLIAQDVQSLFPEAVYGSNNKVDDENNLLTLDYSSFGIIAIKAIQEQQEIINKQQKQIDALQEKVSQLSK